MGASAGKWVSPTGMKKEGSTLVELQINNIFDAHEIIGMQPENFTPISLIPLRARSRCCCVSCCWVSIPQGFGAIVTRFGKDVEGDDEVDGSWTPGWYCFAPWNRVSRLVSRQLMIFDAPVKGCKTKDHVTVHVDLIIVFQITHARDFTYKLGPSNLDSLLRASQEEVMKSMASEIEVDKIFDLFGDDSTQKWVDQMNGKLEEYGVAVRSFTIKNVSMPDAMITSFEDTTLFESRTVEKAAQQESGMVAMENEEALRKLQEECDNHRMADEENAVTAKAQISKEVREVEAQTDKAAALAQAQRNSDVTDVDVHRDLECAKIQAEIMAVKRKHQAQLELEVEKLEAEADAYQKKRWANAKMEAASKVAEGKKILVEAEGSAADAFSARRELQQEMARLKVLEMAATNRKMKVVTSKENATGLAPNNSLVSQIANQGMEAFRMKLAEVTATSAKKLDMGKVVEAGLVRAVPQQEMK